MAALAFALHILGAVVWVGGMFAIDACLRPALGTLEPPQRLRLMRVTFQKFFPWVWIAILLLLASGYWMVFAVFGGFAGAGLHVHLMQMIGWLMIALFVWLFHGPWLAFKRAVDAEDWPSASARLNRIRQIIAVNLPLGLLVVVVGASANSGPFIHFQEISGSTRLRGGPGSCATAQRFQQLRLSNASKRDHEH
jgi:uncharacterized membrane protein